MLITKRVIEYFKSMFNWPAEEESADSPPPAQFTHVVLEELVEKLEDQNKKKPWYDVF